MVKAVERRIREARDAHPEFAGKTVTTGVLQPDGMIQVVNTDSDA